MKKIFQILSIPLTIIFIGILIYGLVIGNSKSSNYNKELMNKYKTKEVRLAYFENNKESFIYIAKLFDKYEDIEKLINKKKNESCNEKEITLTNDLALCVPSSFKEELDKETILNHINNLKDINVIRKEMVINTSNKEVEKSVSFYITESTNTNVSFNYCLNNVECNTSEEYTEKENKISEKNKIDEEWNTIYKE